MKILHFDCFAGISGDMALGALVDLGVDPEALLRELNKFGIPGWRLTFRRDERGGISGLHADVQLEGRTDHIAHSEAAPDEAHAHSHDGTGPHCHTHQHDEAHHDEAHPHSHDGTGPHHHDEVHPHCHSEAHPHCHDEAHPHQHDGTEPHCHDEAHPHSHDGTEPHCHAHQHDEAHAYLHTWKDIRALIEQSGISAGAKRRALAIFTRVAEAEAKVHAKPVDDVAFHEVGALDSIIDIVGTAICLDILNPARITCGEVELGGGTVKCAHGILPVPAPATLLLVQGMPVTSGGFNKEMTTPTGAAILAASVDEFVLGGRFTELATGYGIGTRRTERPNLLRVSWRETHPTDKAASPWHTEELVLMEANIDDMTGEALGFLMESLFAEGALDVTFTPCTMKKARPGVIVACLAAPTELDALRRTLFLRSSTIGFRESVVRRLSLPRKEHSVESDFGSARAKTVFWEEHLLRTKLEYDDRARLAREKGCSLEEAERHLTF